MSAASLFFHRLVVNIVGGLKESMDDRLAALLEYARRLKCQIHILFFTKPQVAQARNTSIGEHRLGCVTF